MMLMTLAAPASYCEPDFGLVCRVSNVHKYGNFFKFYHSLTQHDINGNTNALL